MSQSYEDFEKAFGEPILSSSGDLLSFDEIKEDDMYRLWTIIDGEDDNLWVTAGFHIVNRIGYIRTSKPWITGEEQFRWDD